MSVKAGLLINPMNNEMRQLNEPRRYPRKQRVGTDKIWHSHTNFKHEYMYSFTLKLLNHSFRMTPKHVGINRVVSQTKESDK